MDDRGIAIGVMLEDAAGREPRLSDRLDLPLRVA
jgi:hypothetical protein